MANAQGKARILSQGEQLALIRQPNQKTPTGLRNLCMIMLMLKAGLRAGEVLTLKIDDLDPKAGKVHITESGAAQERILWLDDDLIGLITQWLQKRPQKSSFLFTTLKGGQLKDRYLREMVKRLARKAGIAQNVHPHLLRSTFAVQLIRETSDIRLAQRALGHRDISTTQAYVKHIFKEHSMAYYDLVGFKRSGIPAEETGPGPAQAQKQDSLMNESLKTSDNDETTVISNKPPGTGKNENSKNMELKKREGEEVFNNQALPDKKNCENDSREMSLNQIPGYKTLDDQPAETENLELRISIIEEGEREPLERTQIPALKCSRCTYILHYKEDCPRCGATFASILEYWRKYY